MRSLIVVLLALVISGAAAGGFFLYGERIREALLSPGTPAIAEAPVPRGSALVYARDVTPGTRIAPLRHVAVGTFPIDEIPPDAFAVSDFGNISRTRDAVTGRKVVRSASSGTIIRREDLSDTAPANGIVPASVPNVRILVHETVPAEGEPIRDPDSLGTIRVPAGEVPEGAVVVPGGQGKRAVVRKVLNRRFKGTASAGDPVVTANLGKRVDPGTDWKETGAWKRLTEHFDRLYRITVDPARIVVPTEWLQPVMRSRGTDVGDVWFERISNGTLVRERIASRTTIHTSTFSGPTGCRSQYHWIRLDRRNIDYLRALERRPGKLRIRIRPTGLPAHVAGDEVCVAGTCHAFTNEIPDDQLTAPSPASRKAGNEKSGDGGSAGDRTIRGGAAPETMRGNGWKIRGATMVTDGGGPPIVKGEIVNTTGRPAQEVSVGIAMRDADGERIGVTTVRKRNLPPGKGSTFRVRLKQGATEAEIRNVTGIPAADAAGRSATPSEEGGEGGLVDGLLKYSPKAVGTKIAAKLANGKNPGRSAPGAPGGPSGAGPNPGTFNGPDLPPWCPNIGGRATDPRPLATIIEHLSPEDGKAKDTPEGRTGTPNGVDAGNPGTDPSAAAGGPAVREQTGTMPSDLRTRPTGRTNVAAPPRPGIKPRSRPDPTTARDITSRPGKGPNAVPGPEIRAAPVPAPSVAIPERVRSGPASGGHAPAPSPPAIDPTLPDGPKERASVTVDATAAEGDVLPDGTVEGNGIESPPIPAVAAPSHGTAADSAARTP